MKVVAVVVTWNRKELLLECIDALARQTHPVERVVVVDNNSTDGTVEALEASGLGDRVTLDLVRLTRNGGGSEGFHYGVREALRSESDWIWVMDDDCEPAVDALEKLLSSRAAQDPATSGLAPQVRDAKGQLLPMHRGRIVKRPVRAPAQGPAAGDYDQPETELDFFSFVGPMFRTSVVRDMGPPPREYFIRFEDLEYSARAAERGRMWLVNPAVVVHKENVPLLSLSAKAMWANFSRKGEFRGQWMGVYGLRNIIHGGRKHGYVNGFNALTYVLLQVVRIALFDPAKLRTIRLYALYAYDGWRGLHRSVPPPKWAALEHERDVVGYINEHALRYDTEVDEPVRRLSSASAPAADATPAA